MRTFGNYVRFFQPADLGFNAVSIGAGATVNGNVVAWSAAGSILHFSMYLSQDNANSLALLLSVIDVDQVTVLNSGTINLWGSINNATVSGVHVEGLNGVAIVGTVSGPPTTIPFILSWPYVRFNVINNGASATVVSLRACVTYAPQSQRLNIQ